MQYSDLEKIVLDALEDYKAQDIVVIDIRHRSSFADAMFICTGTSTRHVQAIAENVIVKAKQANVIPVGVEGAKVGDWVLVDLGDVIVHVMLAETRKFYGLEKLWRV